MNRLHMSPETVPPVPWSELRHWGKEIRPRIVLARLVAICLLLVVIQATFQFLSHVLSKEAGPAILALQFIVMIATVVRVFRVTGRPSRLQEDLQLSPMRVIVRESGAQMATILRVAIMAALTAGVFQMLSFFGISHLKGPGEMREFAYLVLHNGVSAGIGIAGSLRIPLGHMGAMGG